MNVTLKYFGVIAEITGKQQELLELPAGSAGDIRINIALKYPAINEINYALAVDQKVVADHVTVTADCEVALLPPFAGG